MNYFTYNNEYLTGFLQGFGIAFIIIGLWLKNNKDYVLLRKKWYRR